MASMVVGVLPAVISARESLSALHTSLLALSSSPGATQLSLAAATESSLVPLLPSEGAGRRQDPEFLESNCRTTGLVCAHPRECGQLLRAGHTELGVRAATLASLPDLRWPQQRAQPAHLLLLLSEGITKDKCKPGLTKPEK